MVAYTAILWPAMNQLPLSTDVIAQFDVQRIWMNTVFQVPWIVHSPAQGGTLGRSGGHCYS